MGAYPCGGHLTKWDLESHTIGDEEWILVSRCYTCGAAPYWQVYPAVEPGGFLAAEPLRTEPVHEDCPDCDGSGYDLALFTPVACRRCGGRGRIVARPRRTRTKRGPWMRYAFAAVAALALVVAIVGWARDVDARPIERVYDYDCSDGAYLAEASC